MKALLAFLIISFSSLWGQYSEFDLPLSLGVSINKNDWEYNTGKNEVFRKIKENKYKLTGLDSSLDRGKPLFEISFLSLSKVNGLNDHASINISYYELAHYNELITQWYKN